MNELLLRRRVAKSKPSILPDGYTQLRYITNPSTAYINTGIAPKLNAVVRATIMWGKPTGGNNVEFGCRRNGTTSTYFYCVRGQFLYGNGSIHGKSVTQNILLDFYGDADMYAFGENVYTRGTKTTSFNSSYSYPIYLFCLNNNDSPTATSPQLSFGEFQYDDDNTHAHLYACKDPNGVIGMYDIIRERFFGSANSIAFEAGPAI